MVGVRASKVVGIERKQFIEDDVAIETTEAAAEAIYVEDASAMSVLLTSGAATSASIYAAARDTDTFYPLGNPAGQALAVPLSDTQWNCLPVEIFNVGWIKLVGDAAGVCTIQTKK